MILHVFVLISSLISTTLASDFISPKPKEEIITGDSYNITWKHNTKKFIGLHLLTADAVNLFIMVTNTTNYGSYVYIFATDIPPGDYFVRMVTDGGIFIDESGVFKIIKAKMSSLLIILSMVGVGAAVVCFFYCIYKFAGRKICCEETASQIPERIVQNPSQKPIPKVQPINNSRMTMVPSHGINPAFNSVIPVSDGVETMYRVRSLQSHEISRSQEYNAKLLSDLASSDIDVQIPYNAASEGACAPQVVYLDPQSSLPEGQVSALVSETYEMSPPQVYNNPQVDRRLTDDMNRDNRQVEFAVLHNNSNCVNNDYY